MILYCQNTKGSLRYLPLKFQVGHRYQNDTDNEIRILQYGHYRITYLVKSQETIDILGVFHGALDIDRYL